jgi:hypothetical protein
MSLLNAKHEQVADHLRSFREDPGYFHDCTKEMNCHRAELLLDKNGLA